MVPYLFTLIHAINHTLTGLVGFGGAQSVLPQYSAFPMKGREERKTDHYYSNSFGIVVLAGSDV